LLVCAFLPKALRDATVLLQYRTARLQESTPRMNSSRQMSSPTAYLVTQGTCPTDHPTAIITSLARCEEVVNNVLGISTLSHTTMRSFSYPPGCFLHYIDGKVTKLVWNSQSPSNRGCENEEVCVCDAEPPIKTETYAVKAGICSTALAVPKTDCLDRAKALGYNIGGHPTLAEDRTGSLPRGCVVHDWFPAGTKRVVYNSDFFNARVCSDRQHCVCFGSKPPPAGAGPPEEPTTTTTTPVADAYSDHCRLCETPIMDWETCFNRAGRLRYNTNQKLDMFDKNYPEGCFVLKHQLWLNHHNPTLPQTAFGLVAPYNQPRPSDGFTGPMCNHDHYGWGAPFACICKGQQVLNPQNISSGTCPTTKPLAWCECERMAKQLGTYTEFERISSPERPARCFLDSDKKLWWNSYLTSTVQCGNSGTQCICAS